jgi:predicted nuclease of predicted toxin-antitoxin system
VTIRLYVDEDAIDNDLVSALRVRGVDVVTAREAGLLEQKDEKHQEYAMRQGRVLFSFNVGDFYRLHATLLAEGKSHAGIITGPEAALLGGRANAPPLETHRRQAG